VGLLEGRSPGCTGHIQVVAAGNRICISKIRTMFEILTTPDTMDRAISRKAKAEQFSRLQ